jgi:hypothetical protein
MRIGSLLASGRSQFIRSGELLLPLLLLLALPGLVRAQFTFTTNADNTLTITKYTGPGGAVTIPEATNGYPITVIGGSGSGIAYQGAFQSCTTLTSLAMENNLSDIETNAFRGCTNLISVTIGNNVTNIAKDAFSGCTGLTTVTIPDSVMVIGISAFKSCTALTNISVGNNVTSLGDNAFYNCSKLARINLGTNLSNIGFQAFYSCANLRYITFPSNLTNIGNYAFQGCANLNNNFFQGNAPSVGSSTFVGLLYPQMYYVQGTTNWSATFAGRPTHLWDPQVPFSYTTNNGNITITGYIYGYNNAGDPEVMIIPSTITGLPVTTIGSSALNNLANTTTLVLPNTLINIGSQAFKGCKSLTSVTFPTNLTSIGSFAFMLCTNLCSLNFQGNAPSADATIFANDTKATVYYFPWTSGWTNPWQLRPTAPWLPQIQTGGSSFGIQTNQFGFNITWASGMTVVVEACDSPTDLGWSALQTNTLASGPWYFSDPKWTNYPARVYRVRSP